MRLMYVCLMSECVNICSSAVCLHVYNYESRRISLPIIIIIFRKKCSFCIFLSLSYSSAL